MRQESHLNSLMKFIIDMVHHNPGEPPFNTAFHDPSHLKSYGFNGQVFKHLNCAVTFAATGIDFFPEGSVERIWLDAAALQFDREISAAKSQGLKVFYHIDLFILPKRLVNAFAAEICDPTTGRISLGSPKTRELHRLMFAELVDRFPAVDGYIVRVGETYLYDTPFHTGNVAIPTCGPAWSTDYLYDEALRHEPLPLAWTAEEAEAYVQLLCFLRNVICEQQDKHLLFRTWDIFPDKLHARREHYLQVTDRVAPHPKLVFSIKHTALDFWRNVNVNPCLGAGQHAQVIEVQCQREYEGKGAFPNYLMRDLIEGFPEHQGRNGLRELVRNPLCLGIYSWSRGGGWNGPQISHELWPDLNMFVLGGFACKSGTSEEILFKRYAQERIGLSGLDVKRFRELCLLSSKVVLHGRYCEAFDRALGGELLPTANWMRDDRLGGRAQLRPVLQYLVAQDKIDEALLEKTYAVELAERMAQLANEIAWNDMETGAFARVSAHYGRRLFALIAAGWHVLTAGTRGEITGVWPVDEIRSAVAEYYSAWDAYRALSSSPVCPSLFLGCYLTPPGLAPLPGLDESVDHYAVRAEVSRHTRPGLEAERSTTPADL